MAAEKSRLKYIGVKDLGNLVLPDFCPRCFWFERHFGPFPARFPGIFNVLDSVSKKSVRRSFFQRKRLPDWLNLPDVKELVRMEEVGRVENYYNRKYLVAYHQKSDWMLRGAPDSIFRLKDGSLHIVDFKTARFTEKQDELFPLYEIQLNGYAILAHKIPVSKLSLVYCEPKAELRNDEDFALEFRPKVVEIKMSKEKIPDLLMKAREIVNQKTPPPARPGCRGTCFYIDKISSEINFGEKPLA